MVLICCFLLVPAKSFAADSAVDEKLLKFELPEFELPELEPLEIPSFSKDYQEMKNELEKEGFGQYKYDLSDPSFSIEVESPEGIGKTGYEKFIEEYGDLWTENRLDVKSIIPDDQFFEDYINTFKEANEEMFNDIKEADRQKMSELLNKKLDMSDLWNINELKKKVQFADVNAFLAGTPKPEGWDAIKNKSFEVPDMDSWLNSTPKAAGYGENIPLWPYLLSRLKFKNDDNNKNLNTSSPQGETVSAAQTQKSVTANTQTQGGSVRIPIPDSKPTFSPVPEVRLPGSTSPVIPPVTSNKNQKEQLKQNPTTSPVPAPSFSIQAKEVGKKVLDAGKKVLEVGRKFVKDNLPIIALTAAIAIGCTLVGPSALALAGI